MEFKDNRGLALDYMAVYLESRLGFPKGDFIEWFSMEEGGRSEKTLKRYMKGDTPMKKWSFAQFWSMVEKTVEGYFEYDNMGKPLAPHAVETWEQEKETQEALCRLFFLDLNAPERAEDFPEAGQGLFKRGEYYKRQFLDSVKLVFEALDKTTAYAVQKNFPAFAAVTADDIRFWGDILNMTAEEKAERRAALLKSQTADAGTILDNLQREDARCWVNLKNVDYKNSAQRSKDNWGRFGEKFMALLPWQFPQTSWFLLTPFLIASAGIDPEVVKKIEVQLPTGEDIELLLLFKYCLAPEERAQFLKSE